MKSAKLIEGMTKLLNFQIAEGIQTGDVEKRRIYLAMMNPQIKNYRVL
jgi:hypothetical protein